MKLKYLLGVGALALSACSSSVDVIDLDDKAAVKNMESVMELEYRDWTKTAENMTESMMKSGGFAKIIEPKIAIGRVTNDTTQRFDTDILVKKIRAALVNSGRALVTTALKNDAAAEDNTTHNVRDLRSDDEWSGQTIAGKGTLVAPNVSLTGKMIQRNLKLADSSKKNRVEYYLQMTLTDVKTGLSVWEGEEPIIKEGKKAAGTW
jgi:uncharacterized protein (TIGR02722 family)